MATSALAFYLKLPFELLALILRYYLFGGVRFRKYSQSLINLIKLKVYRSALQVRIPETKYLGPWSNNVLINKIIPLVSGPMTKIPGYGQPHDANSIWLVKQPDRKPTDPIIIFAHGGGYFFQTMPSQVQSVLSVYHLLLPEKKRKTSILLLDYKLVSHGYSFPTQMLQLDQTYSGLVADGNNNIILMGDSAGGNLSVGYTQFLKAKKDPLVVYPSKLVLVSPWLKLAPLPSDLHVSSSWMQNEHFDLIHYSTFSLLPDLGRIAGTEDPFSLIWSPNGKVPHDPKDWSDIPTYSNPDYDVFVIAGEDESFRDDIVEWANYVLDVPFHGKVRYGFNTEFPEEDYTLIRRDVPGKANLDFHVEPLGVHDSILYFENTVGFYICQALKKGKPFGVKDIDKKYYFGIYRLVTFLDERL